MLYWRGYEYVSIKTYPLLTIDEARLKENSWYIRLKIMKVGGLLIM